MSIAKKPRFFLLALSLFAEAALAQPTINLEGTPVNGDNFAWAVAAGDFNCDGFDDLAAGVPFKNFSGLADIGFISIVYGGTGSGSQLGVLGNSYINVTGGTQSNLQFGGVLAVGNFDGDNCDDLAVGMPYKDIGTDIDTGEVQIYYGHSNGPQSPAEVWSQNTAGVNGAAESYDNFGASLAVGDYNGDGYDDLAVGIPGENSGAGYVFVMYGQALAGLTTTVTGFFSQDSAGIADTLEGGDRFGNSLTSGDFNGDNYDDLAIGAPYEDHLNMTDAGVVHVLYGSSNFLSGTGSQIWHQDSINIRDNERFGHSLAAGDFNGDSRDDLVIGAPYDGYYQSCSGGSPGGCSTSYRGAIHVLPGTSAGVSTQNQLFYQPHGNFGLYGWSLVAADFNGDNRDDLVIGAPQYRIYAPTTSTVIGTGSVFHFYGSATGLPAVWSLAERELHQNVAGVEGGVEFGDNFGWSLAAGNFNGDSRADLVVGVPTEYVLDIGSGMVQVFYGAAGTINPANDQILMQ